MIDGWIDLRSDTVTIPTPEMRQAMAHAVVGDDVYGEDPTINHLQEIAADKMGKEAGLFVSSGTMGNLIAILTHCNRGDEVIMGQMSHTFLYEGGGIASLGGIMPHTIPNQSDGTLKLDLIQSAIRTDDIHYPISRLLILENTQNRCGGIPLTVDYTNQAAELVHQSSLKLHLDGARIFNAAIALNVNVKDLTFPSDSVTFCLSKGLCAPVGSVLCGTKEFINRALRIRKQLGGGMRQAGILAAAGIVALQKMVDRLAEDHLRTKLLARYIGNIHGLVLDSNTVLTNMLFVTLDEHISLSVPQIVEQLKGYKVRVSVVSNRRIRMVMHNWITDEDIKLVAHALLKVLCSEINN